MPYRVLLVSAIQRRESTIVYICTLPLQLPSHSHPSRSSQSTELSPLCDAAASASYFTHGDVYFSVLLCPCAPPSPSVHKSVLYQSPPPFYEVADPLFPLSSSPPSLVLRLLGRTLLLEKKSLNPHYRRMRCLLTPE